MVHLLGRRRLLIDLGRGVVAVALLGTAAACGDDAEPAAPTGSGTPTGAAEPSPSGPPVAGDSTGWTRVDLGIVAAYVLVRGKEAAVVDTGVGGSADAIGESLKAAGGDWPGVKHVMVTHYHPDHAGSMVDVMERATSATGYAGTLDLPSVGSPRELRAIDDGAEVFGLQVIGTPGHTMGHVSFFDPATGVLVAGDALTNSAGLSGSNPRFTADEDAAKASVKRLAELPVKTIFVGHGATLDQNAATALKQLAART